MAQCIFCQIISKDAPSNKVYEDELVMAFLSNRPVNVGHTLVIPKKHYANIYDIPEEDAAYLFRIVKRVANAVKDETGAEGIRIVQNNGEAAGQVVFHLHVHIIPMKPYNQFSLGNTHHDPCPSRDAEALERDSEKIRHACFNLGRINYKQN